MSITQYAFRHHIFSVMPEKNTAIFIFVYLLLERQVVFLLEALALADQVALLSEDGGSRGHFVRGAALAAAAPHRPHLLLVAADAV